MDSVREKITIELARSKIRTEEIYAIIKQIADHIEPPTKAPAPAPAPAPTPAPAPAPAPKPKPAPAPAPAPAPKSAAKKITSPTKKAPAKKAPVKKSE